jgi:hypothetical protein
MVADLLSRRSNLNKGVDINNSIQILPDHLFVRKTDTSKKIYLEDDNETHRNILREIHDTPIGGHCKYPFCAARGTERISCFGLPRSQDRIPQIRRVQPPTPPHQSPFIPHFPHSFLFSPTMNPLRYIFFLAFGIVSQGSP